MDLKSWSLTLCLNCDTQGKALFLLTHVFSLTVDGSQLGHLALESHHFGSPKMVFPSEAKLEVGCRGGEREKHRQTWQSAEPDGQRQLRIREAT